MNTLNYKNKHVVVTGCSSGIGNAVAGQLSALGARVHGVDIRQPAQRLVGFSQADFRDPEAVKAVAESIDAPVDALFNCAGLGPTHCEEDVLRVNFFATRAFTEMLVEKMGRGSAIASIASIGGMGWPLHVAELREFLEIQHFQDAVAWYRKHAVLFPNPYSFTKEAIVVWSKLRSLEWIQQGIRINCTSPGATQTAMMDEIESDLPGFSGAQAVAGPMGRYSSPEEQAWPLLFLNSELGSYINGIDLAADGGGAAKAQITKV